MYYCQQSMAKVMPERSSLAKYLKGDRISPQVVWLERERERRGTAGDLLPKQTHSPDCGGLRSCGVACVFEDSKYLVYLGN